jgi:hypothetical protein
MCLSDVDQNPQAMIHPSDATIRRVKNKVAYEDEGLEEFFTLPPDGDILADLNNVLKVSMPYLTSTLKLMIGD